MTLDRYGPTPGTTVEQIAQAARARGIYADTAHDHRADGGAVLVHAHHATWALYLDPDTILGWIAVRLDADGDEITGTAGWLGASDLEPETIVANLLDRDELPTDLWHRQPPVPTRHRYDPDPPDRAYLDCPGC
ncbi:MAG: hypothetical protein ACOYXW_15540 [Actinomycetota bacterium]